jgi:SAM-dependent methyltransferase
VAPTVDARRRRLVRAIGATPLALAAGLARPQAQPQPQTSDGGPFVPTPWVILDEMLKLADIRTDDTVYDLGSGDGRLVIAAAKRYGARGVGVERDENLVIYSRSQAEVDGVADRVRFVQGDVLQTGVAGATVVTLYLLPRLVTQLVPKLRAELPAGARIVSHDYALEPWRPDKTLIFDVAEKIPITGSTETKLFYYVVPARIHGQWRLESDEPISAAPVVLTIDQWPDRLEGTAILDRGSLQLRDLTLRADAIGFELLNSGLILRFRGRVTGETMAGEMAGRGVKSAWRARRIR